MPPYNFCHPACNLADRKVLTLRPMVQNGPEGFLMVLMIQNSPERSIFWNSKTWFKFLCRSYGPLDANDKSRSQVQSATFSYPCYLQERKYFSPVIWVSPFPKFAMLSPGIWSRCVDRHRFKIFISFCILASLHFFILHLQFNFWIVDLYSSQPFP